MNKIGEIIRLRIILPLAEKLKGLNSYYWYKKILYMNKWPREKIVEWQNEMLVKFIKHAYEHTTYYRELFDSLGLLPSDICCIDDLQKLPIIDKEIIRKRYQDLIPDNISELSYRKGRTGGTTGEPMEYLTDEDTWGYITAAKMVAWKTTSYMFGDKFVALGSASLFKSRPSLPRRIYDKIRQEIPLNSMCLSDEICQNYLNRMRNEDVHYIYGYASSVYLLAKYAYENHIDVSFIKGAFTTSENLTPAYRAMIEMAFNCRVMDCYGCRDAGMACYEVFPEKYLVGYNTLVEIVDTIDNNLGTILSTNVLNYSFPLIRYDYGDIVKLENNDTSYNGQVITKVFGRTSDVFHLDNGRILTSPGFTILMNKFDVIAYDIQKISGTEVKMQIQVVPTKWNKEQEALLVGEMQRFVGEGCEFSVEYVDRFEPLKNGKRRYFMNDLSRSGD